MAEANPLHTDFLSRSAREAEKGFEFLRGLEALAADYSDLGYAPNGTDPITADDAAGDMEGIDPADLALFAQKIAEIGTILNENDGAARKAIKRLAAYSAYSNRR